MKKSTAATLIIFFVLIPLTLWAGTKISGKGYYLTSTLIIIEMLIPFFMAFEGRKPQAKELSLIAVMCALAIVSRIVIPIPHFKPIIAIIMISGIAFGPQAGFIIGAIAALGSNFFAGQGAFTPWQMMAYGAGGMLFGFLSQKGLLPKKPSLLGICAFIATVLWVGPLLDMSTVMMMLSRISFSSVFKILLAGVGVNIIQGSCSFLTVLLFSKPLLEKLQRIKTKYGIMNN